MSLAFHTNPAGDLIALLVRPLLRVLGSVSVIAPALLGGCRATPAYQGSNQQVMATYQYRNLSADLPPNIRVPAVAAAARVSLLERGYSIQSESTTEEQSTISAVAPDAGLFESLEVCVTQGGSGPRIRVVAEPLGDQARSRSVLEGILEMLGR